MSDATVVDAANGEKEDLLLEKKVEKLLKDAVHVEGEEGDKSQEQPESKASKDSK